MDRTPWSGASTRRPQAKQGRHRQIAGVSEREAGIGHIADGRTDASATGVRGPDDLVHLTTSGLLKGAPVLSPSGERLGTLTGAVVYRPSGSIASVELERSWMFGLLRQHVA